MPNFSYNIDIIFYEAMMFLFIETLKNAKFNLVGEVKVFFRQDNKIVSFIIGENYLFKKLFFENSYFSIELINGMGRFQVYNIFYNSIVGFASDVIYMTYFDHANNYNYHELATILPSKLNLLFNYQIRKNLSDLDHYNSNEDMGSMPNREKKNVRITFFKHFPGIELPPSLLNEDKLLVLVLENTNCSVVTDKQGIYLKFADIKGKIFLPYNSIVTYFNESEGLFLNRNVKVTTEDFIQDSYYYSYEENLIYVDFSELLADNIENDLCLFFSKNLFNNNATYPNNKMEDELEEEDIKSDNLIIVKFNRDETLNEDNS